MPLHRTLSNSLATSVALLGLLLLAACTPDPDNDPPPEPVLMLPVSMVDWEVQLGDYPPDILVVDYWASWCTPCLERFPSMIEMAAEYADQGVTFVSFNLDEPDDMISMTQAEDFLQAMQAPFDHFAITEDVFDVMDYLGLESIPAVSIYDRNGVEAVRLGGDASSELFDERDIHAAIQELLSQQPQIR